MMVLILSAKSILSQKKKSKMEDRFFFVIIAEANNI